MLVFESLKDTFSSLIEKLFGEDGKNFNVRHVSQVNSLCFGGQELEEREKRGNLISRNAHNKNAK